MYVINLTVNAGATLQAGVLSSDPDLNIYYTGTLVNNGNIYESDGTTAYTPIKLTPTNYGDFDADAEGDETDDTDRFVAAWCTCGRDDEHATFEDYDPLTDWDCDGDVDNDDKDEYESNWGSGTPPTISAFSGLSSCPHSSVCDE